MRRSRSRRPLRRASSPHPRAQTPPMAQLSKAATSPSLCSEPDSRPELLHPSDSTLTPHSSWYETEAYLDEFHKWPVESAFESLQPHDDSSNGGRELRSRSTQTELGSRPSEPASGVALGALSDEHVEEESWFDFRRLLGTHRNPKSFLVSMAVLAAVLFTLATIAALSGKAGTGEKENNLELLHDSFENEQVAAHEEVEVTAPTTARRAATVVRRRRPATVMLVTRKPAVKARKVARATRRRPKSRRRRRGTPSSTSRPSSTSKRKKRRRHSPAAKVRRPSTQILVSRHHVTSKRPRKRVTVNAPRGSIKEQRDENVVAAITADYDLTAGLKPRTSSMASRPKTSRRISSAVSTLDKDDDTV
ncbi:uncharacterized protein [Dermacentor albipictus]|uniref:uncharacterized protein n=1 Tax=Dermacentor albipictus TaxID=60249 RepID=UPI0031FBC36D